MGIKDWVKKYVIRKKEKPKPAPAPKEGTTPAPFGASGLEKPIDPFGGGISTEPVSRVSAPGGARGEPAAPQPSITTAGTAGGAEGARQISLAGPTEQSMMNIQLARQEELERNRRIDRMTPVELIKETLFGIGTEVPLRDAQGNEIRVGQLVVPGFDIGIGQTAIGVANNPKALALSIKYLGKFFSLKTMAIVGSVAGSIFLGMWGQAEAGEPIAIPLRDAIRQAKETGDWSIVDEAQIALDEITQLDKWEEIAMYVPGIGAVKGITNKIKGVRAGAEILRKMSEKDKEQQETGMTDDEKWAGIREEQATEEKAAVDYYNQERKKFREWEIEAQANARKAEAEAWRKERELQSIKEAEDREAMAEFWLNYRKLAQKIADEDRPSNLNFGLF